MTQWVQVLQWSLEFMIHQNLEHNIILDNKTAFPLFTTGKYHSVDNDDYDDDDEMLLRNG